MSGAPRKERRFLSLLGDAHSRPLRFQRRRKEAILPQVPDRVALRIPFQGVARMRLAEGQSQRFCMAGDGNEMDVIAHQAPSQDAQSVPLGMFAQDFEIALAVFVGEEYCRLLPLA
jgi:hypothetical protein